MEKKDKQTWVKMEWSKMERKKEVPPGTGNVCPRSLLPEAVEELPN